jgi:alkylation response protein AidB-like acyl-CoA dehydrogenase
MVIEYRRHVRSTSKVEGEHMNVSFSDEQEELRISIRRFLQDRSPEVEVRRLMETTEGYDPAVWRQMADQLGLQSLIIPEEYGGSGFSYIELTVVLEEMGAVLLCGPYFSTTALGANALLTSGDASAKRNLLPGIASGEVKATLAYAEDEGKWNVGDVSLVASRSGGEWKLKGQSPSLSTDK